MIFKSVKSKVAGAVAACTIVIVVVLVAYSTTSDLEISIRKTTQYASAAAENYARTINNRLEKALSTARTLAQTLEATKAPVSPLKLSRSDVNQILKNILEKNTDFLGVHSVWEPNAFDGRDREFVKRKFLDEKGTRITYPSYKKLEGHDSTGRFIPYWNRVNETIILEPVYGYETDPFYLLPKQDLSEKIIDPMAYNLQGKDILLTSLMVPILRNNIFYGTVGVDISIGWLQELVDRSNIYGGKAHISIISNNGTIAAASHQIYLVGKNISENLKDPVKILQQIQLGRSFTEHLEDSIHIYAPLKIGGIGSPWTVAIKVPMDIITAEAETQMWRSILISGGLSLFAILSIIFLVTRILRPIGLIADNARGVAVGDFEYRQIKTSEDEIGQLHKAWGDVVTFLKSLDEIMRAVSVGNFSSEATVRSEKDQLGKSINQMIRNFRTAVKQAYAISRGDLSKEIVPRSEKDELGNALLEMTKSLRTSVNENERQNWLKTSQMALNDTIRGELDTIKLGDLIISFLARTLHTPLGTIYMNEDGTLFSLVGSYAALGSEGIPQTVRLGEGLVGEAAKNRTEIVTENIPESYYRVHSSLGHTSAKKLFVVPCIYNTEVVAVIELATLSTLSPLETEFLHMVSEPVAIALSAAKARTRLEELLEKTQKQAERLQTQQEELRQTNEELEEQTKTLKESEAQLQQQQEELRVTNEELEERTKALEKQRNEVLEKNEKLKVAQKEIEKKARDLELASRYKSEFLANMSHELRTPLNSILVLSQLLSANKSDKLSEKEVEFARTINSSGTDLLNLINDILDLSKVESGKMELNLEDTPLTDIFSDMERLFGHIAEKKGISLITKIAPDSPSSIYCDPQKLNQILKNLLSNAFKFTEQGHVTLSAFLPGKDEDLSKSGLTAGDAVAIAVSDTGIGIPEEKQRLIFEAFQQADGTTSRKYGGTGLGLSISRELAKLLGGEIKLESRAGEGSTFTIFIPRRCAQIKEQVPPEPVERFEKAPRSFVKPAVPKTAPPEEGVVKDDRKKLVPGEKSILIVEDDPNFSQILMNLARERGFKCLLSESGETGLHMADYYKPTAIILDIGLPGIDGWEVMERLKENPETRHIPVHFMSATDKSLDAFKMGAIGYLTKPVTVEQIDTTFGKIEEIISSPVKRLLIVEDDETLRNSIVELIGAEDVEITAVGTGTEGVELLAKEPFDCMILDLGLKDMNGFDLLKRIKREKDLKTLPVIIYTGRELSRREESELEKYSESIIIKGARSPERLLDETTLFLHRLESTLPEEKRRMIRMVHKKEEVMKDRKILIVDDDMRNVFAITSLLEEKGLKVIVGRNGMEGIEMLEKNEDTDLVLMDIMMPEMDGYEAMRRIRGMGKYQKLPIIALTAKAMKGDKAKCIEAGANDYLSKPIDADKLFSLLRVWMYR